MVVVVVLVHLVKSLETMQTIIPTASTWVIGLLWGPISHDTSAIQQQGVLDVPQQQQWLPNWWSLWWF